MFLNGIELSFAMTVRSTRRAFLAHHRNNKGRFNIHIYGSLLQLCYYPTEGKQNSKEEWDLTKTATFHSTPNSITPQVSHNPAIFMLDIKIFITKDLYVPCVNSILY